MKNKKIQVSKKVVIFNVLYDMLFIFLGGMILLIGIFLISGSGESEYVCQDFVSNTWKYLLLLVAILGFWFSLKIDILEKYNLSGREILIFLLPTGIITLGVIGIIFHDFFYFYLNQEYCTQVFPNISFSAKNQPLWLEILKSSNKFSFYGYIISTVSMYYYFSAYFKNK